LIESLQGHNVFSLLEKYQTVSGSHVLSTLNVSGAATAAILARVHGVKRGKFSFLKCWVCGWGTGYELCGQMNNLRSALFWGIMQCRVVILYRRFGTTYRSHLQGSNLLGLLDL
jgi:hypothetical protein